jgi:hypothetical protein
MHVDTGNTVEIRASPFRLLLLGCGGLAAAVLSYAIARTYAGTGSFREFIGWVGVVFCGLVVLVAVWRALRMRQPMLTLAPAGFRDIRIASQFIPWSAVENLSIWRYRNTKTVVVKVGESVWRDFPLSRMARWSRSANISLGVDGLAIGTVELPMKSEELLEMMAAFVRAHGGRTG